MPSSWVPYGATGLWLKGLRHADVAVPSVVVRCLADADAPLFRGAFVIMTRHRIGSNHSVFSADSSFFWAFVPPCLMARPQTSPSEES